MAGCDEKATRFLVIGFGNPGRLDDGLGPALATRLEGATLPGVTVDADYQLQVEDAESVSRHDVVVFADAALSGPAPFSVTEVQPRRGVTFSSHSLEPADVLGLAFDLFQASARGFLLGIRGYEFDEFGERLSPEAVRNLDAATSFLLGVLARDDVESLSARAQAPAPAATNSA